MQHLEHAGSRCSQHHEAGTATEYTRKGRCNEAHGSALYALTTVQPAASISYGCTTKSHDEPLKSHREPLLKTNDPLSTFRHWPGPRQRCKCITRAQRSSRTPDATTQFLAAEALSRASSLSPDARGDQFANTSSEGTDGVTSKTRKKKPQVPSRAALAERGRCRRGRETARS